VVSKNVEGLKSPLVIGGACGPACGCTPGIPATGACAVVATGPAFACSSPES